MCAKTKSEPVLISSLIPSRALRNAEADCTVQLVDIAFAFCCQLIDVVVYCLHCSHIEFVISVHFCTFSSLASWVYVIVSNKSS
jgi:hypothetical protein